MTRILRFIGVVAALICLAGTVWVAWADWRRRSVTDDGFRDALRMVPGNWVYYQDLAEFRPDAAVVNLRKAIELNPLNASLRIELGEYAERNRDFATAAEAFRGATRLDKTYAAWGELVGFCLRRRDESGFRDAARGALSVAGPERDLAELYQGCFEFGIQIPDRLLGGYLGWLMGSGHLEAARPVAARIIASDSLGFTQIMGEYCERLLSAGDTESAWAVWNWIRPPRPSGLGFDWRYFSGKGVYFEKDRVSLNGDEPENFDLVWRYVYVEPGAAYSIRAGDLPSGFRWMLGGNRLVLRYERVKGAVRFDGDFRVQLADLVKE